MPCVVNEEGTKCSGTCPTRTLTTSTAIGTGSGVRASGLARYWLCPRGTEDDPLPSDWFHQDTWREENTRGYGTGIRGTPRIKPGDQIVWYATKPWQVLYGLAEVTGPPEQSQVPDRRGVLWRWYIPARTWFVVPNLEIAPTREDAGLPSTGSVRPCKRLTPEQFEACCREINEVGRPHDEPCK